MLGIMVSTTQLEPSSHNGLRVQLDQQWQQSYDGYIQHAHVQPACTECKMRRSLKYPFRQRQGMRWV